MKPTTNFVNNTALDADSPVILDTFSEASFGSRQLKVAEMCGRQSKRETPRKRSADIWWVQNKKKHLKGRLQKKITSSKFLTTKSTKN